MLKFAVLFAVLFVSIQAKPWGWGGNNPWLPNNLDQDDGVVQGQGAAQNYPNYGNQGGQGAAQNYPNYGNQGGFNEPGDTPDDDQQGQDQQGQNPNPQGATTMPPGSQAPGGGDSSSSSSEEGSDAPDAPDGGPVTAGPSVGPLGAGNQANQGANQGAGANQGTGAGAEAAAGQSSDGNVDVQIIEAAPIQPNAAGQSSGDTPGGPANPLRLKPQEIKAKKEQGRNSGLVTAFTTTLLVGGVAATSIVVYKYKDAIKARMGL